MSSAESGCCVCGASDARGLAEVVLTGGARVTLCGTHSLMLQRAAASPSCEADLRRLLRDRRGRRDRREQRDELGEALTAAFQLDRRADDRRRAT